MSVSQNKKIKNKKEKKVSVIVWVFGILIAHISTPLIAHMKVQPFKVKRGSFSA